MNKSNLTKFVLITALIVLTIINTTGFWAIDVSAASMILEAGGTDMTLCNYKGCGIDLNRFYHSGLLIAGTSFLILAVITAYLILNRK